jgi:hypothetical protein
MDPGSRHGSRKMKGVHSQEWIATRPVEPQGKRSLFTSRGREEVLTTIKMHRSAQQKNAHE